VRGIFGYVHPLKNELRFREYDYYRAFYCGVCRSIGRRYGQLPRFTLINETGMLAMILDYTLGSGEFPLIKRKTCIAHPVKKIASVKENSFVDYCADINVLLAWYKLQDGWKDDKDLKCLSGMTLLRRAVSKAKRYNPKLAELVKCQIALQSKVEADKCASIDEASHPFATLIGNFCANAATKYDEDLYFLGYNLGKWIYLIDAFDDINDDIKTGAYNPLVLRWEKTTDETAEYFTQRIMIDVRFTLEMCLATCGELWERITEKRRQNETCKEAYDVMNNIIFLGLRAITDRILNKELTAK